MMVNRRSTLHINIFLALVAAWMAAGCSLRAAQTLAATPAAPTQATWITSSPALSPAMTPAGPTATPVPTLEPSQTAAPTSTSTPDPYGAYSVDYLAHRSYGGGELQVEQVLAVNSYYTRTLVSYPSDDLMIYGFMDIPQEDRVTASEGLPVVIALHGYIDPAIYTTLDYTTRYADALARAGFLVIHPNLRGYAPSGDGDNLFRVGMAIDVLNLIALVKQQAGKPGPLESANPGAIGIWGHSMGGGISTRVITVSPDVRAAVLYGAMSGDDHQNYERIFSYFSNEQRGQEQLDAPQEAFLRISPIYYLDRIQAAVSIHHGDSDVDVPLAWSLDLCQRLQVLGKSVECFTYEGQPHTFYGDGDQLFIQRTIEFFRLWLGE
jgi:dipeptidyl aminopeptidase/acylaminoacyl peptidase